MAVAMTARLRRDNAKCECARLRPEVVARGQNPCIPELRPLQAWYLTEALEAGALKELVQALERMLPWGDLSRAGCHEGITTAEKCTQCGPILRARAALAKVRP